MNKFYSKDGEFLHKMLLIREFETHILKLYSEGKLSGTTHTYSGQEATAIAVLDHASDQDFIFSNHRCHGHYIGLTDDVEGLFYEIIGADSGVNQGFGGSQHLHVNRFYSSGIQGGNLPLALGAVFNSRIKGEQSIAIVFIGDGTWGQGVVYESLNIAALLDIPLLLVVENNGYAQSTPIQTNTSGKIIDRAKAFGISANETSSRDVTELWGLFNHYIAQVRFEKKPHVQIINTYRFNAHSKGDDFRAQEEIDFYKNNFDPIEIHKKRITESDINRIQKEVLERINLLSA
jgi:TPP-dependent pyruvate/acetoin dehydrogenase alpha subunit